MTTGRPGFDPARFLASAHACLAGSWLAGVGLFRPLEGAAFVGLVTLTAIRWRSTAEAIGDRSIRVPLVLFGCLMAWMLLACAWGEGEGSRISECPHRTFLAVLMVLGARMPAWGLVLSLSVPGVWWGIGLLVSAAGLSDGRLFVPLSPSDTFMGFTGLAACGIAGTLVGGSVLVRVAGAAALLVALIGLSSVASRTTIASVSAALVVCVAVRIVRSREWRGAAFAAGAVLVVAALVPFLPVWTKATHYLKQEPESAIESHPNRLVQFYRRVDPARAFLHEWTAVRIPERPFVGHGAGSWRFDLRRGEPHVTQPSGRFDEWWQRLGNKAAHAHSVYLQTAYEYGLVGLALLLAVGTSLAIAAIRRPLDGPAAVALVVLVAAGVTGLADRSLNTRYGSATFATLFALVACRNAATAADQDPTRR